MLSSRHFVAVACVCAMASPAIAQSRKDDHWVATWAPALVVRNAPAAARQGGPAPAPLATQGPTAAPAASAGPAALAPPTAGAAPAAGVRAAGPGGPAGPPQAGPGGGGRGGRGPGGPPVTINNRTIRQIVHTTLGGRRVRLVLSNVYGAPLAIGAAHVALRECADAKPGCSRSSETAIAGSARPITVNGKTAFTLVPGGSLVTDPIDLDVPSVADLVIDLFVPSSDAAAASPIAWHSASSQTSFVSEDGNFSGAAKIDPVTARPASWFLIARVEVAVPGNAAAVVAFGDSITDGSLSTLDGNSRWPDYLARRLAARKGGRSFAVLNAGIGGNQLLADGAGVSALARFDRDVLMQSGATHVIILEGINDIGIARTNPTPSAEDLIAAHKQLIARAKAQGLTVIGATLTPFEGASYYSTEGEAKRTALNEWIRTSGEYDAVIDFDKITRDPMNPKRFNPLYDSGDHLHPKDAGYQAMGEAIDLALFK